MKIEYALIIANRYCRCRGIEVDEAELIKALATVIAYAEKMLEQENN